ncbi:L-histidine N(alpha)-methyltransferase [Natronoglycomyces albus]|uniref:L-histidine N(Alpha)-methyltransferase n=1 Tax=Natronoglycomyces albus TaxID=2811108 RepID=A0A895XQT9_9ACTN|nr:L-histidine N(alpha)-methyltransferase [Natronoglycomyces albus]QSB04640.1 L-histidine N(alpha)-methyltransferase [Natronoglycomyces albus]
MTTNPQITVLIDDSDLHNELRADVRGGMASHPKWMPPKWFYDKRGSALFEQITQLPDYYPTRCETEILLEHSKDIVTAAKAHTIVELGSGMSEKTRILLDAFHNHGDLRAYYPFDVSDVTVEDSLEILTQTYPHLKLGGVVGDFTRHLHHLPTGEGRLVVLLGSTIGNMLPTERAELLTNLRQELKPGEQFLLGADLVKDTQTLIAAYDDPQGVTAKFNKNLLHVLNRHFDGDFQPENFSHVVIWDDKAAVIEMRLRAQKGMRVDLSALDMELTFQAGEDLHTSVSTKFRPDALRAELDAAGFGVTHHWDDERNYYTLLLAEAI